MNATPPAPGGRDGEGSATYLPKGEAGISFLTERTALLVIDPVNDFLSEGGAGWEMTKHTVQMNNVIGNLRRAIEGAGVLAYEAAIRVNYPLIANAVLTVDEFLAAVSASAVGHADVRPGDTVRGSDHGKIGTVDKVVAATAEQEAYLLVPRGLI